MTEYADASHPTPWWTCQALWPPHDKKEKPVWRAVFFDTSREGAKRSMDWALDQDTGHLGRALDFRVMPPTMEPFKAGAPWDPPAQRRRAAKALAASARVAQERGARLAPRSVPSKAPDPPTAPAKATRARAADRFRAAARPKKGAKR